MRVTGLDHIVLVTADVERLLAWYVDVLGLAPERVEQWRAGECGFPSVRVSESTIIDLFAGERTGVNQDHFCLTVTDADLDALAGSGSFTVVDGPREVWGARGIGRSIYLADPDGNHVELRTYPST